MASKTKIMTNHRM